MSNEMTFPAKVTNLAASVDNPIKYGIFVRRVGAEDAEYVTAHGLHRTSYNNLAKTEQPVEWTDAFKPWFKDQLMLGDCSAILQHWMQEAFKAGFSANAPKRESSDVEAFRAIKKELQFYSKFESYLAELKTDSNGKPYFDFKHTHVHNDGGDRARYALEQLETIFNDIEGDN